MWPFSKKPAGPSAWDLKEARRVARIEWLQTAYPLARIFQYLGRDCVPTCHWYFVPCFDTGGSWRAELSCDYADDHGVIRTLTLSYAEAVALKGMTGVAPS